MSTPDLLPYLESILACARVELDPPPARSIIAPGLVAWDECCDGFLWVKVDGISQPTSQAGPYGHALWVVSLSVGVLRCAATLDEAGNPPSAEALTADAVQALLDMEALARALRCCGVTPMQLGNWSPQGPSGACYGGEWTATVRIPAVCCPSEVTG